MSKTKRRKPVKRATDRAGIALPTRRELDFVRLIAGYLRFRLPEDFERDLRYVRTFLDTFAYKRSGPVFKSDVQRRCAIARQFAYEGRPLTDYAEKLGVTMEQAALLEPFDHIGQSRQGAADMTRQIAQPQRPPGRHRQRAEHEVVEQRQLIVALELGVERRRQVEHEPRQGNPGFPLTFVQPPRFLRHALNPTT